MAALHAAMRPSIGTQSVPATSQYHTGAPCVLWRPRLQRVAQPRRLYVPRAAPSDGYAHPDWPSSPPGRYDGLRDEDVLELESFLRVFRQGQAQRDAEMQGPGQVYLVGTGPGDPGLLTLRAVQLMQTADVVLYDRLVSDDILNLVGPQARMLYVGKHSGFHTRSQDEIHTLLLAFAQAGATVIRLKAGDPYVFGRGGEEMQYLSAHGIEVHCVPGITAASGICAELGIPMTHRGVATSVRFLTGHARDGGEQELLDSTVAGAADPHTTLVVYMGLQTLPYLYQQLSAHGMPADLPAVAIERGTTRRQKVVWGCVSELPTRAQSAGLKSPTLIIMGQVVALAPGWQQWQAAGEPIIMKQNLPTHGYSTPAIDVLLLQQPSGTTRSSGDAEQQAGHGGSASPRASTTHRSSTLQVETASPLSVQEVQYAGVQGYVESSRRSVTVSVEDYVLEPVTPPPSPQSLMGVSVGLVTDLVPEQLRTVSRQLELVAEQTQVAPAQLQVVQDVDAQASIGSMLSMSSMENISSMEDVAGEEEDVDGCEGGLCDIVDWLEEEYHDDVAVVGQQAVQSETQQVNSGQVEHGDCDGGEDGMCSIF